MKKIILFLGIIIAAGFTACDDDISDLNIDPKSATEVDAEVLFSYSTESLSRQMANIDYNVNIDKLWSNILTQTTYIEESSYDPTSRDVGYYMWDNIYTEMLTELKEAKSLLRAEEVSSALEAAQDNKIAMIKVLEVYAWQYLVDNFGDIPYSEALDIDNTTPVYDDAESIYLSIADSLSNAVALMDTDDSGFDSTYDLLYGGDMASWKKFAGSLQLKLGIRLSDVNTTEAQSLISAAVSTGVFESNDDNASFAFITSEPYVNPIYNFFTTDSRSGDFVATSFFVDLLNSYNDPRIAYFYDDNISSGYVGGDYGVKGNTYSVLSHLSSTCTASDYPGMLMDYAAVSFALAEAVERGYITGDAEAYYEQGITASFDSWGATDAELSTYLAESTVDYSAGTWKEQIGIQKYFAAFIQGHEAWTEAKRLDFPVLVTVNTYDDDGVTVLSSTANPKRMIYPSNESSINEVNYDNASAAIGGDELDTPVFWDVN
jgi:hypothetical protein